MPGRPINSGPIVWGRRYFIWTTTHIEAKVYTVTPESPPPSHTKEKVIKFGTALSLRLYKANDTPMKNFAIDTISAGLSEVKRADTHTHPNGKMERKGKQARNYARRPPKTPYIIHEAARPLVILTTIIALSESTRAREEYSTWGE